MSDLMTRLCGVVLLLLAASCVPPSGLAAEESKSAGVQELLLTFQAAYCGRVDYRGTLGHEVGGGGAVLRQDLIDLTYRRPGFLSLRWKTGTFKGTALLSRLNWNRGSLLIRLGNWFDYLTFNVPPTEVGEPFVPGLKDLSEWLTALYSLTQRPATDRSLRQLEVRTADPNLAEGQVLLLVPAFLIPFRDNTVSTYEFVIERGTGVPMELVLRGAGGDIRQRMTYVDLQMNVG